MSFNHPLSKNNAAFFWVCCVVRNVFFLIPKHHEVFRPVVVLISVNMMDDLSGEKWPTYFLLCYATMFVSSVVFFVCVGCARSFQNLFPLSDRFFLGI